MEQKSKLDRSSPSWKKHLSEIRKKSGQKGGLTTALKHCANDSDFARTRASRGGVAVLARYGREYFQFLATRAKTKSSKPKSRATAPFPLDKPNLAQVTV